jgi:peptide/nickel transport system substrate-binding protein
MAESVPTMENGQVKLLNTGETDKDGNPLQKMEVTWKIKKSMKWNDGKPVTADDFIFAHEVCLDKEQEIIDRSVCERVEKMEAKGEDKKTLVVTWRRPFAFFNAYRVHDSLPAHVLRPRYKMPGGGTNNLKKDDYGKKPMSNGPFKFKEWIPGQYITYVRNENHEPLAKLEEVTIKIIPNNQALESNLVAGTIDGAAPTGGLTVNRIEEIKKRHGDKFTYHSVPGMVWAHIDFNLDNKLLADKRVRHAIAHSINRAELIEKLYHGKYDISHTFLPPRHWGYNANIKTYDFDLEKASRLLDEAGWKRKKEGDIRTNKKGEKLIFKFSAVAGVKDIEQVEQLIQSNLKTIGAQMEIDNKPAKAFFGEFARHRKFPHMSFYAWISSPDSWSNTLWQSDYIPSKENNWQGQNYPGWRNEEVTEILKGIPEILDEQKRKVKMARVQELYAEDLPVIPMYFRPVVAVTRPDLENYRPTGTLTPATWNSHAWSFKAPAAKAP